MTIDMFPNDTRHQVTAALQLIVQDLALLQQRLQDLVAALPYCLPAPRATNGPEDTSQSPQLDAQAPPDDIAQPFSLADWLSCRRLKLIAYRELGSKEHILIDIAVFLGDRLDNLMELYSRIKRSVTNKTPFKYNLWASSVNEIQAATLFCQKLFKYGFLRKYHYKKLEKMVYATPSNDGDVTCFLTGGWLEWYLFEKTRLAAVQAGKNFSAVLNGHIATKSGAEFELDLLCLLDHEPLWIECKTGLYQGAIHKYATLRKTLDIPTSRSILVLLGKPRTLTEELTNLYGITVTNENGFVSLIHRLATNATPDTREVALCQQTQTDPTPEVRELCFPKNIRPLPEHRRTVLTHVCSILSSNEGDATLRHIMGDVAARVGVSKSVVRTVLNALVQAKVMFDVDGNPVRSSSQAIAGLAPQDLDAIDRECVRIYARVMIEFDSDFFADPANLLAFEISVGAKAPDSKTIARLQEAVRDRR